MEKDSIFLCYPAMRSVWAEAAAALTAEGENKTAWPQHLQSKVAAMKTCSISHGICPTTANTGNA
ncbi:hypothetical protein C7N83_05435 [Neisseria iguanae]|uniref:Uncharacterized protein n=1 Tax=Neisseria iguanae TaxID=90242 RepID=A0A2P7U0Q1_9NEIS|nr:hypothetical protein C7N83_05435 [Neisseria iguanae]